MSTVHQFISLLDPSIHTDNVDINTLKRLAHKGIPDHPPHIRSYTYSLLLAILPPAKSQWENAIAEQKKRYNSLVDFFSNQLESLPKPTSPSSLEDELLINIARIVQHQHGRHSFLRSHTTAEDSSASPSRRAFHNRIHQIVSHAQATPTTPSTSRSHPTPSPPSSSPRITLTSDHKPAGPRPPRLQTSHLAITVLNGHTSPTQQSPITLLSPKPIPHTAIPETVGDVMTRMLFVFSRAHPEIPYYAGLVDILIPLYVVFSHHGPLEAEAHTFTAFESLLAEMRGPICDPTETAGHIGHTIISVNPPYHEWLCSHHLDPATPLYTYRWITSLLAADVPRHSLLHFWDLLLAEPSVLPDLCAAILLTVRPLLLRPQHERGLWDNVDDDGSDLIRHLGILRSLPMQSDMRQVFIETAVQLIHRRKVSPLVNPAAVPSLTPPAPSWSESTRGKAKQVSSGLNQAASWWTDKRNTDSASPGESVHAGSSRLQQRLADLADTPPAILGHGKSASLSNVVPRPLLLGKSARRISSTSNSQPDRSRRGSTPVSPPSAITSATLSPPSSSSLYRIGSRQGLAKYSRSPSIVALQDLQAPLSSMHI